MAKRKGIVSRSRKQSSLKRYPKKEREQRVLLGLVDLYIKLGQPVGSNTLKNSGFEDLSSATIRNYFSKLEEAGYLQQQHSSGGRIPTQSAYRLYIDEMRDREVLPEEAARSIRELGEVESPEIAGYLQRAAEVLSQLTHTAVFLSAPRFDHDVIRDIQLMRLDLRRLLCVFLTEFGLVHTEVLHLEWDLSEEAFSDVQLYFRWRIRGEEGPSPKLEEDDESRYQRLYNEVMMRYIVGYSNFTDEDVYRTGFSKLLDYPDFADMASLAAGLSLFESAQSMRLMLRESIRSSSCRVWVGDDLTPYSRHKIDCSVVSMPYRIHQGVVGAIGLLGPMRLPYAQVFGILRAMTDEVSRSLTKTVYRFKMTYRCPQSSDVYLQDEERFLLEERGPILLEDKRLSQRGRKRKI